MTTPTLGKYEILEKLGAGATADVYHARDTVLGREVALKVLKPALVPDTAAFNRFIQEAQAAARLFHPHIATVLDMGEEQGRYFIAMRYIPGKSLDRLLQEDGALPWPEALRLAQQVGAALDHAHAEGFLHRDVKPSNIIRDEKGDFWLTDFGLTRAMISTGLTSTTGALMGTPPYIPPEIWDGQPALPASDQYALACVVYEALTGQVLFRGETPPAIMTAHMLKGANLPEQWPQGTPVGLSAVLEIALHKDPAGRWPSASEFARTLGELTRTEEQYRREAAKQARLQAQAADRKKADDDAAQEKARQEAESRAQREAEEQARKAAQERAEQDARDRARLQQAQQPITPPHGVAPLPQMTAAPAKKPRPWYLRWQTCLIGAVLLVVVTIGIIIIGSFAGLSLLNNLFSPASVVYPTPTSRSTIPPPHNTAAPTNTPRPAPTSTRQSTEAPAPTEATGETPPNIVAGQLNVIAVNGYQDDWGDWTIVGLISNNTDRFVNDIEVEVEIFDASDNSLYVDTTYTSLYSLAPGEVTPFTMNVWDDVPDADHFVATITDNGTSGAKRGTAEITNSTLMLDEYDDLQIVGEITNNSGNILSISGMAAAVFDSAGNLITADSVNVTIRYLEPGDSGPFRISIDAPSDQAASLTDYTIYVDAQITDAADKYDLVLSDETFDYADNYGDFHLVGQITNNSDEYMNVSLVAGLYDASGNVIDAASAPLPVYSLAPGETLPYDFDYWGPVNYVDGAYDAATNYSIFIDWYWTWDTTTELVDLTTQGDANEFDSYRGTFTGQVVNNTDAELESATVIVVLYEVGTDTVVAVGYDWLFDNIAAGGTADYEVNIDIPKGWSASDVEYALIVKGEK